MILRQLEDDDYETREAATRRLALLGYAAAAHLRVAKDSSSAEVRWRTRRLLDRLDFRQSAVQLKGHQSDLECVCFSPDGTLLASGDREGTIKVWRVQDWSEITTLALPGTSSP